MERILQASTDLSSQVETADAYPILYGPLAEIWRGILRPSKSAGGETQVVALKALRRGVEWDDGTVRRLSKEVAKWSELRHSNILQVLGVGIGPGSRGAWIAYPWQANGTVMNFLRTRYQNDSEGHQLVFNLVHDVAKGLNFMHTVGNSIHGDIKGSNIFVNDQHVAMISPFGLSGMDEFPSSISTIVGQSQILIGIGWTAPERLDAEEFGLTPSDARTKASDVYSYGMTIFEILSGSAPYAGGAGQAMLSIMAKEKPRSKNTFRSSPELLNFLEPLMAACTAFDRKERPTSVEIIEKYNQYLETA